VAERERIANNVYIDPAFPNNLGVVGDLVSKPELDPHHHVVFDERLVLCARAILGRRVLYFGDSSFQVGEGQRGFHKDNVDRADALGPDWLGEYGVIRMGVYLQDHRRFSGGLKVRRGSHWFVSRHIGTAVNVPSEPGDVVIWSMRTSHSGNNVRIRGFSNFCFLPRIETRVPRAWRVPEQLERLAMFVSYATPGPHATRLMRYFAGRDDFRRHWRHSCARPSARRVAASAGVDWAFPTADYGSDCGAHSHCRVGT
jgi:hypothetical protein